ncbi:MAG: o-succinylbenzoate synthase [Snowella sp.]|nr:o-succinylbenzoate synthase [Snowella sp.]
MKYQFKFFPYQRKFKIPLETHHGRWSVREGIILQLINEEHIGWGEIAPLPWFGSETLEQAFNFCQSIGSCFNEELIDEIPDHLPACQFGFESALKNVSSQKPILNFDLPAHKYSYLLPTGKKALDHLSRITMNDENSLSDRESLTYKWKIGVQNFTQEISIFEQLVEQLPLNSRLRLDANGGLSLEEAQRWLSFTDQIRQIEFIEQPLPPDQFYELLTLSQNFKTAIALDESVANLKQLKECYELGWRGIYVIKAAIMGSPRQLKQFCQNHTIDAVFSSVFETSIGQQAVLALAQELNNRDRKAALRDRALGFGVNQWFQDADPNFLHLIP